MRRVREKIVALHRREYRFSQGCEDWGAEVLDRDPLGIAFWQRLSNLLEGPPSKVIRKLKTFSERIASRRDFPGYDEETRGFAVEIIDGQRAQITPGEAGRKSGPLATGADVYAAAVTMVPKHVSEAIAVDLRERALQLAEAPADNLERCRAWKIEHLHREERIEVIANHIRADAERLASECHSRIVGSSQGRAGWEAVARLLMAKWRSLPDVPNYLKNAAYPSVLKANANSYAVQKSKAKKRTAAD